MFWQEIGYKVYRGMSELLKCVLAGIEHSYKHLKGLGGLASALQLLEVVHTHYYCKRELSICLPDASHSAGVAAAAYGDPLGDLIEAFPAATLLILPG